MNNDWKERFEEIIMGIDKDECGDKYGWWETSYGASFGADVKNKLEVFIQSEIDKAYERGLNKGKSDESTALVKEELDKAYTRGFIEGENSIIDIEWLDKRLDKAKKEAKKEIIQKIRTLNTLWIKDFRNEIYTKNDIFNHIDVTLDNLLKDVEEGGGK